MRGCVTIWLGCWEGRILSQMKKGDARKWLGAVDRPWALTWNGFRRNFLERAFAISASIEIIATDDLWAGGGIVAIKTVLRVVSLVSGTACSGCVSGLPAPSGEVWHWVVAVTHDNREQPDAVALEARINAEFGPRLAMSVRQFEDMLEAEHFQCNFTPQYFSPRYRRSGPGTADTRDCTYFQRGPIGENACVPGENVAVSIAYSYPNSDTISNVTRFNTRVIMATDPGANASGICFPLQ